MSSIDIHQHAARKRTASEAGPSRPPKRHQTSMQVQAAPAPVVASTSTEEPDAPSASIPELVLALSAPTVLPAASSEERAVRKTIEALSVVPSTEEVRIEAGEPEQSATAPVAPSAGAQSSSSFPSLSNMGLSTRDRRKAQMTSTKDAASEGHTVHFDLQVPDDELTLVNLTLAK